jgi:hypothetical protein
MTDPRAETIRDAINNSTCQGENCAGCDAARALDSLAAENERLREALRHIRDFLKFAANSEGGEVAKIDHLLGKGTSE